MSIIHCECGCGEEIQALDKQGRPHRFINGHQGYKGESAPYRTKHHWARRHVPRPKLCRICKTNEAIEVHNISKRYLRVVEDWMWVCIPCHRRLQPNPKIDMSNRKCSLCGSSTTKIETTDYIHWYHMNGELVCNACWNKHYNIKNRDRLRLYKRYYMRKYRERKRLAKGGQ